jgi:SynChlorMet cassette protein ScmC
MINSKTYSNGYCLELSDGNSWWITCDDENKKRIDKLASIMKLQACPINNSPKIIFSEPLRTDTPSCYCEYPSCEINSSNDNTNWNVYNYRSVRIWNHNENPDFICEIMENSDELVEYVIFWNSLMPIYWKSTTLKGIPFHSGLAEYQGKGVLFAASGGTGKSTCCRRLPDHWNPLCDDEALIVLDKNNQYRVHPFPTWSDYLFKRAENKWDVQYSVPLSAIFFIEQSPYDEVIPLSIPESAMLITESSAQTWNRFFSCMARELQIKISQEIFNNAFNIAKSIPAFRLRVSLIGQFWEKIEKIID